MRAETKYHATCLISCFMVIAQTARCDSQPTLASWKLVAVLSLRCANYVDWNLSLQVDNL